jgi:UDP-3-O-[3-hydroxymyristoyl] glucosamine N-acyltransferase
MKFNNKNVFISPKAVIGNNVRIGDNTIIYDNVHIEDNSTIANDCVIGEPTNSYYFDALYSNPITKIGSNSLIRSHAIIYAGSTFGKNFSCGHRVTIRENVVAGDFFSVGTLCDIQGYVNFGDYCRLHSNVHIGQQSNIGNFVFIYPYVVFTNDPHPPSNICKGPTIGDYTQIAVHSVILPMVEIGQNCLIGANSTVSMNFENDLVIVGSPAKAVCSIFDIKSKEKIGEKHYPWMNNFERGMPWEGIGFEKWKSEKKNPY